MSFKTRVYHTILLFTICIFSVSKARNNSPYNNDSILITTNINEALVTQNPEEAATLIYDTRRHIKNSDNLTKQLFYFNLGRYFFIKGDLDSAQANCNLAKY